MITKILKFGASWCGPCKALDKVLEKYDDVPIIKYDVDDESVEPLIEKYGIRNVPVMILLDGEEEAGRIIGAVSLDVLRTKVLSYANQDN